MKLIIKALLSAGVLCLLTIFVSHMSNTSHRDLSSEEHIQPFPKEKPVYRFNNQDLAYKILNRLDLFEPLEKYIYIRTKGKTPKYDKIFLGLKHDEEYCARHRAYIVEYPETIFEQVNFFIEETNSSFVRSVALKPLGNDTHPHIASNMPVKKQNTPLYDLMPNVNIFFTKNDMFVFMKVGLHFSCLTQMSNHIPGHGYLAMKDYVADAVIRYAEKFENRPQCFSYDKFFPKTWILDNEEQCKEFFQNLNSEEYKRLKEDRRIVYIRKKGRESHRGEGVQPVNEVEEAELKRDYDNGNKCGQIVKSYLVQHFIHNPLLLDGHKFDFRVYMLIASTNPLIAYYHDGFLRVTLAEYDVNSDEKKVLLTNLALNKQIYNDVKGGRLYEGKDEESLKLAQQWSYDRLQTYLLENGVINDSEWLDNYLRPEMKKAMIHLLRLSSDTFLKRSSVFELFGVDFMLDSNLNLWFIEANAGPAFKGYSKPMEKFILGMLSDHLEIVTGLMKSRMKRIVNYVNMLVDTKQALKGTGGKAWIQDVAAKRQEFKELTKNYFEEEFKLKPTNGFSKILDEWYDGVERYQGFIDEQCL